MKFPPLFVALASALSLSGANSFAQAVKDREAAVRNDKATMENDKRWMYNDIAAGFAEAKKTGKPLMIVLRCVPCLACSGIDTQVLLQETELTPLMNQFVCVRVINANALDLSLFQFDYDLSFSTLFFNADGTLYGRYGSWMHQKDAQDKSTASLRRALEAALELHKAYPANKPSLAGKQGGPTPFKVPVELPALAEKYTLDLNWSGKVVQSCVHCHQVGDALRLSYRDKKEVIPTQWIYPFPAPETIGLTLASDQIAQVDAVTPGSPAERAGLKPGDALVSFAGQPLISIADVSWALHRAPDAGSIPVTYRRGNTDATASADITLPEGWRSKSDISHRVGTWGMRGMACGGMVLEDTPDEERANRGLGKNDLALHIKGVGSYGKHAAAKNAGFQKDDVILSIDGLTSRLSEGELIGQLLKHQPGETVSATVLRGAQKVSLTLPIQ